MQNPFFLNTYLGPDSFCDRKKETETLLSAIENRRNITLFSLRRMGKTGLIQHIFHHIQEKNDFLTVYVDVMATSDVSEFVSTVAKAWFNAEAKSQSLVKKWMTSVSGLRPVLSYDPVTGNPEISVQPGTGAQAETSLDTLFQAMDSYPKPVVLAIDEFQQIANYPEKNMEALLRTSIQRLKTMRFVFLGSSKQMLSEIFTHPGRPFFSSTEMMELHPIDADAYKAFIVEKFAQKKAVFSDAAFVMLEELTGLHTFYVQFLCNKLFSQSKKQIDSTDVLTAYASILEENSSVYATYLRVLTPLQFRVLRAIANEQPAKELTGKDFLTRNGLGAASSVQRAAQSLSDTDFIHQTSAGWAVQDVFFAGWLRSKR